MDCYFRQYWQDKRLSFKSPIKSLSLSIKVRAFSQKGVNLLFTVILKLTTRLLSLIDARENVETRYVFLQRQEIAYPHNHSSK